MIGIVNDPITVVVRNGHSNPNYVSVPAGFGAIVTATVYSLD